MGRAEYRRQQKAAKKHKKHMSAPKGAPIASTNILIANEVNRRTKEMSDNAMNAALVLTMALPMKVLIDHYWTKSYKSRLPKFAEYVLEYYRKFENDEIDIEELQKELWDNCGVRFQFKK